MTNLHHLPEPVPEGWYASERFADTWSRPYGPPEDVPTRAGEDRGVLTVERVPQGYAIGFGPYPKGARTYYDTLSEACAAAERAFCGCYVGAKVPGTWGKG